MLLRECITYRKRYSSRSRGEIESAIYDKVVVNNSIENQLPKTVPVIVLVLKGSTP
jgi:hypothetical protein